MPILIAPTNAKTTNAGRCAPFLRRHLYSGGVVNKYHCPYKANPSGAPTANEMSFQSRAFVRRSYERPVVKDAS